MPYRLAIFETHPIQYKVPWFRALHSHPDIDLTVIYCMIPDAHQQGKGFGVDFQWDIPLLEGYNTIVLENVARQPGVTHFSGCDTPGIRQLLAGKMTHGRHGRYGREAIPEDASDQLGPNVRRVSRGSPPKFDAVIINGWVVKSCLQALWSCRREGIPAILRCEANHLQPRAWWKTLVHKQLLKQFSAFMAIGQSNREFYTRRGVASDRIVDGFYCVENERIGGGTGIGESASGGRGNRNSPEPPQTMRPESARAACPVSSPGVLADRRNGDEYEQREGDYGPDASGGRGNRHSPGPPHDTRPESCRERWEIPEKAVCFLFCGKFEAKKRPMDVIRALALTTNWANGANGREGNASGGRGNLDSPEPPKTMRSDVGNSCVIRVDNAHSRRCNEGSGESRLPGGVRGDSPIHGLMVGDGELRTECEAYAREHALPVTFAGFLNQSEISQAYAAADCLVLASDYGETWGLVVNEAMACGLPAIVSDRVGCHPDLVIEDETGHVVPFGDTEALARAMSKAAGDREGLRRMGERARAHITSYSIDNLVEGTLAALRIACPRMAPMSTNPAE